MSVGSGIISPLMLLILLFIFSLFFFCNHLNIFLIELTFRFANFWILSRREARLEFFICLGLRVVLFAPFDTFRNFLIVFTLAIFTWQTILFKKYFITRIVIFLCLISIRLALRLLWLVEKCTDCHELPHLSLFCKIIIPLIEATLYSWV